MESLANTFIQDEQVDLGPNGVLDASYTLQSALERVDPTAKYLGGSNPNQAPDAPVTHHVNLSGEVYIEA